MNNNKTITWIELIIVFFIIVILFSTIFITYFDFTKNYNIKLSKDNHLTIISIIEEEKRKCSDELNEWIWNDKITVTCGSIFVENQTDKFFNDIIKLKNPYDKRNAVYAVSSIPNTLSPGINYIMLNKDNNSLKVTTLLEYDGQLIETKKDFK